MKDEKAKGYEWIGDADETVEAPANEHSEKYYEPNRDYDNEYSPTKDDIKTFPDLQNGPSSLIQGSPVAIQQVGIHNFRLPLKYSKRGGGDMASSKAFLFGGGGGMGGRGGGRQTTFSVSMGSMGSNKAPKKGKKGTVITKKEADKKMKDKKHKAKKEEPKPKVDGATLDMDMDSYFANRPAKAAADA